MSELGGDGWNTHLHFYKVGRKRAEDGACEQAVSRCVCLALAGMAYGHPVTVVTDTGLEPIIARMLCAYGVRVEQVTEPHPQGGWQQARCDRVAQLLTEDPEAWNPDQYNNPDNTGCRSDSRDT